MATASSQPQTGEEESYAFSDWDRVGENGVRFATFTWGNAITTTAGTQCICLAVDGDAETLDPWHGQWAASRVLAGRVGRGAEVELPGRFLDPGVLLPPGGAAGRIR